MEVWEYRGFLMLRQGNFMQWKWCKQAGAELCQAQFQLSQMSEPKLFQFRLSSLKTSSYHFVCWGYLPVIVFLWGGWVKASQQLFSTHFSVVGLCKISWTILNSIDFFRIDPKNPPFPLLGMGGRAKQINFNKLSRYLFGTTLIFYLFTN